VAKASQTYLEALSRKPQRIASFKQSRKCSSSYKEMKAIQTGKHKQSMANALGSSLVEKTTMALLSVQSEKGASNIQRKRYTSHASSASYKKPISPVRKEEL
jgi:nitrogen-specific signal transduction histidine kinase